MITSGGIIGRAFQIYREQFVTLFAAALVIFLLELVAAWLLWILAGLVSLILGIFYQGMVVRLVRDVQDGRRDSSMGELFSAVTPVALPLLVVSILFGIGVGIGLILLIVPGLILLTIWAVVAPVTVIERPGIFAAFGRSRELVRGHGWTVFGVIVLVFLISVGVSRGRRAHRRAARRHGPRPRPVDRRRADRADRGAGGLGALFRARRSLRPAPAERSSSRDFAGRSPRPRDLAVPPSGHAAGCAFAASIVGSPYSGMIATASISTSAPGRACPAVETTVMAVRCSPHTDRDAAYPTCASTPSTR